MSAPNAGRQSPDPEKQKDSQISSQSSPNDQGGAPSSDHAAEESKKQLSGLESNPTGPLEHASKEKTAKGNGNPTLGGN